MRRKEAIKILWTSFVFFMLGVSLVLPIFDHRPVSADIATEHLGNDVWTSDYGVMVAGRMRFSKVTSIHEGEITKIVAYMGGVAANVDTIAAIYEADRDLLAESDEVRVTTTHGWWNFAFDPPVEITASTDYYIGVFSETGGSITIWRDDDTGTLYYQNGLTYPTFPDPASFTSYSTQNLCLYAVVEYEAAEWQNVTQGYFTFKNTSAFDNVLSGYFRLSNTSTFKDINSGYFLFHNTSSYITVSSGWFSLLNTSSINLISEGYIAFFNTASTSTISEGYFTFASTPVWSNVISGYFTFRNTGAFQSVTSGYVTFASSSAFTTIDEGWFRFQTDPPLWNDVPLSFAEELYEYNDVYDAIQSIYSVNWKSQGFQVGAIAENTTYTLTAVGLRLLNIGSPTGYLTVGLRAINPVTKKPTGADLSTGTLLASSVSGPPYAWHKISMTPYTLSPGASYCIVFRLPSGDVSNYLRYAYATSSNPYPGGANAISSSSGSTWTVYATRDAEFRIYGQKTGTFDHTWFTFQSPGSIQTITSGYFSFVNVSSNQIIDDGYFTFLSGVSWFTVSSGYFTFSNVSAFTDMTTPGWFNFTNSSSTKTVEEGWFTFAHVPLWRNIDSGYFRFFNTSNWVILDSGWFSFENESNATPIPRIILPHPGATVRFTTPFLVTYSVYSSKKEPVNVSLQVIYLGESGWVNLTNQALNSDDYYLNSTIDISLVMAALGITADYNSPYTLNLNATNYVTHLYADTQSNFRLRDSTYDMIVLFFPLILLLLFSILAFWKQSKIILTATITTAILYATILATQFAGTIDTWYVVLLIVYALALSTMFFFWKKKGIKA